VHDLERPFVAAEKRCGAELHLHIGLILDRQRAVVEDRQSAVLEVRPRKHRIRQRRRGATFARKRARLPAGAPASGVALPVNVPARTMRAPGPGEKAEHRHGQEGCGAEAWITPPPI